ncbi:MAG: phosphatase PAP2 family protein [Lachnospiraceae bacterium]|nr:phosphatase PAP2 family protein [Lachnospiraceae bacterium]
MEITSAAIWINETFSAFDSGITTAIHKLYEIAGGFFTPFFEFISILGKGGIFLLFLSFMLILFRRTRRFGTAMLIGISIGFLITNLFLKVFIARPRPYVDKNNIFYQFWLLVDQNVESDKSFPSGHTTAAFATMTPVFILGKKRLKVVALLFAVLMAVARIYLVVHYPSDVLAGIIVGVFAGSLAVLITNTLPRKWFQRDLRVKKRTS